MIEVIGWTAALVALALLPFYLLMTAVVGAAYLGRREKRVNLRTFGSAPRFLLIIPAHDEEAMIASTVGGCLALDYDPGRFSIHVIADNCSDSTAIRAGEAGAKVFERFDDEAKSKGHALEDFFATIADARPETSDYDAAVIVDADTVIDRDILNVFADSLARGHDWIQAYYTVSNADASWRTQLMTYAFSLANGAWMRGLDRLGLGVGLKGNGMCFSRRGLRRFPWRAYGLVEDMEFAQMLRVAGERVRFRPDAVVYGEMVSRGGPAAESQRIRWEAGRKSLRRKFRGPLSASPHLTMIQKAAYLVDLHFPPLGQLAIATVVPALFSAWSAMQHSSILLRFDASIYCAYLIILAMYAVSPIFVMALPWHYLLSIARMPQYLAWKLIRIVGRRPKSWIRTPREVG